MRRLPHVTGVELLRDYRVRLSFDDGVVGELDLQGWLWGPAFEGVHDPTVFGQVKVDPELGTIVWPGGVDLDPCELYDEVVASSASASSR